MAMGSMKVQYGQTLSGIAKSNNTTVGALAKANNIKDVNKIMAGQTLKLPGDSFQGRAPTSAQGRTPAATAPLPPPRPTNLTPGVSPTSPSAPTSPAAGATPTRPGAPTTGAAPTSPTAAAPGATPGAAPTRPAAPGAVDVQTLGKLSAKYESNGKPGTVSTGAGDRGGVSYGSYQFASNTGSAKAFVDSLNKTNPEYGRAFAGLTPGTPAFSKAWKDLAARDPQGFAQAQHDHIASKFYEPAKARTEGAVRGLDFGSRSQALNDVLWSTAVQHGPAGAANVIQRALSGKDASQMSDADIAKAIYAERGRKNANGSMAYFSGSSAGVQRGVSNRFQSELRDALAAMGQN
jgi:LysM repeat protein